MKQKTNKIQCKKCQAVIESTNRFDFKFCPCKTVAVYGGAEDGYARHIGKEEDYIELSEYEEDSPN